VAHDLLEEWKSPPKNGFQLAPLGQLFCHSVAQIKMRQEEIMDLIASLSQSGRNNQGLFPEQEMLIRSRQLDEYIRDHVKSDLDHLFQLHYILLLPRREVVFLETILLDIKIIERVPESVRGVFLEHLKRYVLRQFHSFSQEKDYLDAALEFRKILGERLKNQPFVLEMIEYFDNHVTEVIPAYF